MFSVVDRLVKQLGHVVVVQSVSDAPAAAFAVNQAEIAQQPELVRHRRLLHSYRLSQVPDGCGRFSEAPQNEQATGRGKGLEGCSDRLRFSNIERCSTSTAFDSMSHVASILPGIT